MSPTGPIRPKGRGRLFSPSLAEVRRAAARRRRRSVPRVRGPVREALARIVAAAEAEGMIVLPMNRFGCIVVVPYQGGQKVTMKRSPSSAIPGHQDEPDVTVIDDFEPA